MKIFFSLLFLAVLSAGYNQGNRWGPRTGLVHMLEVKEGPGATGMGFESPMTASRAVSGVCGDKQYSMGTLSSASAAGVTTPETCAAYVVDFNKNSKSPAAYISYSKSADKCVWFRECGCLASSSTCSGGDIWISVSLSDVFVTPVDVIQTAPPVAAKPATVVPDTSAPAPAVQNKGECDPTATNLMQTFQSQCAMSQSVTFARMVAGIVIAAVILVVGGIFGYAYWLDRDDMMKVSS